MLYYLSHYSASFEPLNVFRYETFRGLAAALTALLLSWVCGPATIRILTRLKLGQPLRQKSEVRQLADLHSSKKGTPTMGGLLILGSVTVSSLLWCDPFNHLYWLVLGSMLYLGLIGFADDFEKVAKKNSKGIRGWKKLAAQLLLAAFVFLYLRYFAEYPGASDRLFIPFLKAPFALNMGVLAVVFFAVVIMGTSNAVNLTDGLDGLATGCFLTVALTYAVFAYLAGNAKLAAYLFLPIVSGAGDLAVFCAALVGSSLGFLWFNCHPARVFMGDTGSLALGGALGVMAICLHQELALVIAGGVFVMEAGSVLLQVASFKLTGKRIFAMSPLHHHFELKGWNESTVTVRFWILSLLSSILALATLTAMSTQFNPSLRRVAVLGLGESGWAAARLLHEEGVPEITVRDTATTGAALLARAGELRGLGIKVELGFDAKPGAAGDRFDLGILSPGVPPNSPLVSALLANQVPMIGELELGFRYCQCPVIAITGTNGKTTTTELVTALLTAGGKRTLAAGNIGTAFSRAVGRSRELDLLVLEVSSFQLENVRDFKPHIGVHLNLTPDHLDRYASLAAYGETKWRLFAQQSRLDFAVVNGALSRPELSAQTITFDAFGRPADYTLEAGWLCARGCPVLEQSRTRLIGPHNAENMLAALAVADLCAIDRTQSSASLTAYAPLPHRCERVATIAGVDYINDSKATNVDALEKALAAMASPVVLIAGGKDKGLDFSSLTPLIARKARAVVLIGQMAAPLQALWAGAVPCRLAQTLAEAVRLAQMLAQAGDTVLLSPGCSSYDMFTSFEDRGDQFRAIVRSLSPSDHP